MCWGRRTDAAGSKQKNQMNELWDTQQVNQRLYFFFNLYATHYTPVKYVYRVYGITRLFLLSDYNFMAI